MKTGSRHSGPGDGCTLASIWVCNVLASNFQRPPDRGPEKDFQGSPRSDLSDGRRELHLGRPTDSRRTSHARFRYLGTNDFPLDETSAERPGASKMLACLSSKSPGSHRGDGPLYRSDDNLRCALLLLHHRPRWRRIVNFNVTSHPTAGWIIQQLREAFPYQSAPRFLIFDRDAKYGLEVPIAVRSMAIRPVRTSFQSPWQNGIAERWVESCRRDLFDHVIAFNERHLKRLLSDYVRYYHEDRTHLGLRKETPAGRVRSTDRGTVVSQARLGGLHHRYDRAA